MHDRINEALAQLESELNEEKKGEGKDRGFIDKLKRDRDMYKKELHQLILTLINKCLNTLSYLKRLTFFDSPDPINKFYRLKKKWFYD